MADPGVPVPDPPGVHPASENEPVPEKKPEIWKVVLAIICGLIIVIVLGLLFANHERTLPHSISNANFTKVSPAAQAKIDKCSGSDEAKKNCISDIKSEDIAQAITDDSVWFHELWVRWLLIDWGLTFFAAGSAVTAAIKNAYSSKSQPQAQISRMDLLVAILAVGAVLASTFEAKLHASELADRYRYGDLMLQDAKADYGKALSDGKSQKEATQILYDAWKDAQKHLEGPFAKDKPAVVDAVHPATTTAQH